MFLNELLKKETFKNIFKGTSHFNLLIFLAYPPFLLLWWVQLNTKGSETSAAVTEEDDDDEDAAPPVIAPRPDHTKSVSDWWPALDVLKRSQDA